LRVIWEGAVCIEEGEKKLYLDPKRRREHAVVTHAHLDHLVDGALMTPPTMDVMKVRMPSNDVFATAACFRERTPVGDFHVELHEAGHVLGSAMVNVGDILYTGDFDTVMGITCGAAEPLPCETLIVEATYGDPRFVLPDPEGVRNDLLSWMEDSLTSAPVMLGGYEFGKAQDLVALANSIHVPVVVPDSIAMICEVYRKHGVPLEFTPFSAASRDLLNSSHVFVTSRKELRHPCPEHVRAHRKKGARAAYISGWAAFWNYTSTYDVDAQFPLSNHADFARILEFAQACKPKQIFTVHGSSASLAKEIEARLKIPAKPLK